MQLSNRAYNFMNTFAIFAPIVSAVLAGAQQATPGNGIYWMALFVVIPVLMTLLAAKLINNQKFFISATILMFTCNLMNVIFFHMPGSGILVISVLLLQLFIAVPSLLYGLIMKLQRKRGAV
ncbi:MAG: hypothetical protein RLT87_13020 [Gammaproteobacteria bacterium]